MASPPGTLPQLNIPRKRTSTASVTSASKKRKPSNLRNSFAPELDNVGSPLRFSRSPSVDSSVVTAGGGRRKRKANDERSVTGTSLRDGRGAEGSAVGAPSNEGEGEGGDDEEDEDEEGEHADLGKLDEAEEKLTHEHQRLLLDAMTPAQEERFALYRRLKPKTEIVRRLTNQTLSQSVPPNVLIAIRGYTKVFIGELIDRAITVRDEWNAARTHLPNPDIPTNLLYTSLNHPLAHSSDARPNQQDIQNAGLLPSQVESDTKIWVPIPEEKTLSERLNERNQGPLTPDHLREALRRYKRDRDGNGAGFAGLSLEGAERTAARMGGRRLFR